MAKPIKHKEGASAIAALRFMALLCVVLGPGAALMMVMLSDNDAFTYTLAGALAFSGILYWVLLSVFAYMAQCVGRLAMHADEAARSTQDD